MLLPKTLRPTALSRRNKLIALFLLLSLLYHLFITNLFFKYGFQSHVANFIKALSSTLSQQELEKIKEKKKQRREALDKVLKLMRTEKPERYGRLVAARGNFGWTLFENAASTQEKKVLIATPIPTTMDGTVTTAHSHYATEIETAETTNENPEIFDGRNEEAAESSNETPHREVVITPWAPLEPIEKIDTAAPDKALEGSDGVTQPTTYVAPETHKKEPPTTLSAIPELGASIDSRPDKDLPAQPVATLITGKSKEERIEQIDKLTQAIADGDYFSFATKQRAKRPQKAPAKTAGNGPRRTIVRGAAREGDKNSQREIIALTKGFIEKIDGENGKDFIDYESEEEAPPDYSLLKYMMYEGKISWCLQATWKQNFQNAPHSRTPSLCQAFFIFTLDKKGYVITSELLQSTGYQDLDNMVLKTITLSSPFPPVPSYFNCETYETGRRINIIHSQARC
jgi:hypothetical protein